MVSEVLKGNIVSTPQLRAELEMEGNQAARDSESYSLGVRTQKIQHNSKKPPGFVSVRSRAIQSAPSRARVAANFPVHPGADVGPAQAVDEGILPGAVGAAVAMGADPPQGGDPDMGADRPVERADMDMGADRPVERADMADQDEQPEEVVPGAEQLGVVDMTGEHQPGQGGTSLVYSEDERDDQAYNAWQYWRDPTPSVTDSELGLEVGCRRIPFIGASVILRPTQLAAPDIAPGAASGGPRAPYEGLPSAEGELSRDRRTLSQYREVAGRMEELLK